jgi:hypothetical protein
MRTRLRLRRAVLCVLLLSGTPLALRAYDVSAPDDLTPLRESLVALAVSPSPAVRDTIRARDADGVERLYDRIRCPVLGQSRGSYGIAPGQTGLAAAGGHRITVPAGRINRAASINIADVPDPGGMRVAVTIDPPDAVVGDLLLTLSYSGCAVRGNPGSLRIVNLTRGVQIADAVHDPVGRTITAPVRDFSDFVLAEPL